MSDAKVKVIIKRPDEQYGHVTNISTRLENIQKTVEGRFEVVRLGDGDVMLCNEEGKLLNLDRNFVMGFWPFVDMICGTVIIIGTEGEDFVDVHMSFKTWKHLLKKWEEDVINAHA